MSVMPCGPCGRCSQRRQQHEGGRGSTGRRTSLSWDLVVEQLPLGSVILTSFLLRRRYAASSRVGVSAVRGSRHPHVAQIDSAVSAVCFARGTNEAR
jgi:hypothetical protein